MTEPLLTKDFPPGWGHIEVPMGSRQAALSALALYTPSRSRGALVQRAARGVVRVLGPRALPGKAVPWTPAVPAEIWEGLTQAWRQALGPWETLVSYRRREGREGAILLLLATDGPLAFVKALPEAPTTEAAALRAVATYSTASFSAPRLLGEGTVGTWNWLAMSPIPPKPHRMEADPPLDSVISEIQLALASLPKPSGTPDHWCPAHGDFTPWNLRSIRGQGRWLLDWEDAGWAPPDGDRVLYVAAAAALQRPVAQQEIEPGEAADYWRQKVLRRVAERQSRGGAETAQGSADDLERRLLDALTPSAESGSIRPDDGKDG